MLASIFAFLDIEHLTKASRGILKFVSKADTENGMARPHFLDTEINARSRTPRRLHPGLRALLVARASARSARSAEVTDAALGGASAPLLPQL